MIILNNKRNVIKSNYNNQSSEFTIDDKSKPFFMQLMRSGIYTKKEQAVVREYVTNAFDEHIAHNVDRPVTIHVPTFDKPELWIRDYAKGLSDDDIRNIYISYGNSTKRNTNDLTGCMGIGCKAGFALDSKQFNIVSIHQDSPDNRVKRTYCAYLDDDDVGKIDLLSAEPTNEPTGICIKIGVSQRHINVFNSEINRIYNSAINKPELINITNNNEHVAKEYEVLHVNDNLQYTKYGRHIDALENVLMLVWVTSITQLTMQLSNAATLTLIQVLLVYYANAQSLFVSISALSISLHLVKAYNTTTIQYKLLLPDSKRLLNISLPNA